MKGIIVLGIVAMMFMYFMVSKGIDAVSKPKDPIKVVEKQLSGEVDNVYNVYYEYNVINGDTIACDTIVAIRQ